MTTPLSKTVEQTNNILEMNSKVLDLHCFVSDLSKDENFILNDPPILYNMPIKKDEVYEALFEADYDT